MTRAPRVPAFVLACLLTLCCLLAQAAPALAAGDDPVLKRMDAVLEENTRLRDEAWKSRRHGREATQRAEEALAASEDRVEKARVDALAHVAGVSPAQVEGLRRDGRSWGQAAGELGVHPGFLGVGKTPMYEPASVRKAIQAQKAKKGRKGKLARKGAKDGTDAEVKAAKKGGAKAEKKSKPRKKKSRQ
jgi:hypothetical protein